MRLSFKLLLPTILAKSFADTIELRAAVPKSSRRLQTLWQNIGTQTSATYPSNELGKSVDVSQDGSVMVAGAAGFVYIYDIIGYGVVQRSYTLTVENSDWTYGRHARISADGNVLVVTDPFINYNGESGYDGRGYVYDLTPSAAILRQEVMSPDESARFGDPLYINPSGTVICFGAVHSQKAWVYKYDGSSFVQRGPQIVPDRLATYRFVCSNSGDTIVMGHWQYNNFKGLVRVLQWNSNTSNYNIMHNIEGGSGNPDPDYFGYSVDINSDGTMFVAGSAYHDSRKGKVEVYELLQGSYVVKESFTGPSNGIIGDQVKMTPDGNTIAFSSRGKNQVFVYKYDGSNYIQYGQTLGGTGGYGGSESYLGIGLSADSRVLAIGALHDHYVHVFVDSLVSESPSKVLSHSPSSKPSTPPSVSQSNKPSLKPSISPSDIPSRIPSDGPSVTESSPPSDVPSQLPSVKPSVYPSFSCHANCTKKKQCYGSTDWIKKCKPCPLCKTLCLNRCKSNRCMRGRWRYKCRGCSYC